VTRLTVKHRFGASAERVYDAWLDPKIARQFLYTTGTTEVVRCEIDARVGGKYTIVDKRDTEEVLHEGTYLEMERPRRLVFTLRVPKYSPDEDRITLDITPLERGCELTLTTETADEWADDTQRGWAMILDVLDEVLPGDASTCGAGLAQHAAVPRRVAIYFSELSETLELHREMLVLNDPVSRREDEVYRDLATSYRRIAADLKSIAQGMAAQRELPMGEHDESKWSSAHLKAFARFVHEETALASVLHKAAERDAKMLASMQQSTSATAPD
jgi:uncharacterized protein YndB with AHSA1/START domain